MAQTANAPTPIRDPLQEPPARDSAAKPVIRVRSWLHRIVPFGFLRFLMIFFIGVVATLAWQSYGRAARGLMASWLAPGHIVQDAPIPFAETSSDDLQAMSRSLAALRDSVDKLAADVAKLQATRRGTPDAAAHLPSSAEVPAQKPVPQAPTPSRAPPTR